MRALLLCLTICLVSVAAQTAATTSTSSSSTMASAAAMNQQQELRDPIWELKYVIIIDAGSSGSRIHVHPYKDTKPIPRIQSSKSLKLTPGLSSFETQPHGAGKNIHRLLEFAKLHIPMSHWKDTRVFLMATAGLRSIPKPISENILGVCRAVMEHFPFQYHDSWVKIISGKQEGIYGWIAANYLHGSFHNENNVKTVGVIEMGGASMQVSFVPDQVLDDYQQYLTPVQVGPHRFNLYTHSYLNYGLESARNSVVEKMKANNPCFNKNNPVVADAAGKFDACYEVSGLLWNRTCPKAKPVAIHRCGLNGIFMPPIQNEQFFAIENFFYTSQFFGIDLSKNPFSDLEKKGEEYCQQDFSIVKAAYQHESVQALTKYCFSSAYLVRILKDGLGIDRPEVNVKVRREINGIGIDWAIGAALHQVSNPDLPADNNHNIQKKEEEVKPLVTVASDTYCIPVTSTHLALVLLCLLVAVLYKTVDVKQKMKK